MTGSYDQKGDTIKLRPVSRELMDRAVIAHSAIHEGELVRHKWHELRFDVDLELADEIREIWPWMDEFITEEDGKMEMRIRPSENVPWASVILTTLDKLYIMQNPILPRDDVLVAE